MLRNAPCLMALITLALSSGLSACEKPSNPTVASTSLALALDLRVDQGAVEEHYTDLKEQFSEGEVEVQELRDDEVIPRAGAL